MANILADGVKFAPHIKAFNDLVEQRFADIDRTPLLVYMIDTVPASALPYLAEQFDVLGIKGWKYADTEQKQRDLIKKAIELHRYKGTPWSIKEALKAIGVANCTILEGVLSFVYNGEYLHDGTLSYGWSQWATFRVLIDADAFPNASAAVLAEMRQLIIEYKNERSHLVDISFSLNDTDTLPLSDDYMLNYGLPTEIIGPGIDYSGAFYHSGEHLHNRELDELTVTIVNVP